MLLLGLWVRILVSFWFVDELPLCPDTVGTVDPSTGWTTVSVVTKGKHGKGVAQAEARATAEVRVQCLSVASPPFQDDDVVLE